MALPSSVVGRIGVVKELGSSYGGIGVVEVVLTPGTGGLCPVPVGKPPVTEGRPLKSLLAMLGELEPGGSASL